MYARASAFLAATAVLAGCVTHGSSMTNVLPQDATRRAPAAALRGQIISLKHVTLITRKQMSTGVVNGVLIQLTGKPKCDVLLYAVRYDTIGVKGEAADASAAFMVPGKACGAGPYPLVGYAHGTNVAKNQLITDPSTSNPSWTAPDQNPITVAAIYAAHGYAVAATDYLGLGESTYPFHPYLHVASEATAVIDALRAIRLAAKRLNVPLRAGTGVFLSGHSQGGQVSVGTQRAIESGAYKGEFSVLFDTASSGPYALSQTFRDSVRNQSQDAPLLAAYALTGYQKIYGNLYKEPTEVFQKPYAAGVDTLLPVHSYVQANALLGKTLPLKLTRLLQPAWAQQFLKKANNPARIAAADNNVIGGWKPVGPLALCGGKRDPEVEFRNAIKAQRYFESVHAHIVPLRDVDDIIPPSVPFVDYHVTVALFCLTLMRDVNIDPIAYPGGVP